jgi:predicted TIM-barrel fold metal-dependent hydrolase
LGSRRDIDLLAAHLGQWPKLTVVVAHLHGFEFLAESAIIRRDNLFFDISNSYFVSKERILKALSKVGDGRLTMGSDTPYGRDALRLTMERVDLLPLNAGAKENILGNNLQRILGLPPNSPGKRP